MRTFFFAVVIGWSAVVPASAAETLAQVKNCMSSVNPEVRVAAIKQFVGELDPSAHPDQIAEALPILLSGLSDPTPGARESSATGFLIVAAATLRAELPANPSLPDLTVLPQVQQALLTAISDNDPAVRQAAIQAYAGTYKLTPDLEKKIIHEFNSYQPTPGQPDNRFAMLGSLVNDRSPSPLATKFIVEKTEDPHFGIEALGCLASLKEPPADVLPRLLREAGQPNISEGRKAALTRAIKAYGPAAKARLARRLSTAR